MFRLPLPCELAEEGFGTLPALHSGGPLGKRRPVCFYRSMTTVKSQARDALARLRRVPGNRPPAQVHVRGIGT